MTNVFLRALVNPALAPHVLADCARALSSCGTVVHNQNDADLNCSAVTCVPATNRLAAAMDVLAASAAGPYAAGRAYRIELMSDDPAGLPDEETLRTIAVAAHGSFAAPVYVAHRTVPAAAWAFARPMPWGRKGLSVGQTGPTLPFGGAECRGVAIEVGAPMVILKARLDGVPDQALVRMCAAVGGADSGFSDVGAYAAASEADGASLVVLEFGDLKRAPLHRTLALLDVEAHRYGGRLGAAALLSHVPLDALLDVLAARTGLDAKPAQVLETHLAAMPQRPR
ncbi:MAG TPA: hypothetical protein VJN22_02275 [Candidatus Eremiobacteraceae bacterium]|nr:hypothetical protein [Candidatus Eremiobacteraceae bacterium]